MAQSSLDANCARDCLLVVGGEERTYNGRDRWQAGVNASPGAVTSVFQPRSKLDRWLACEANMRPVPVVAMEPSGQRGISLL
jgi:hypothetical protein